ncbi:stage II sporulation protein R [Anaerostipes hadrus]|nr:stage II sporulation protein R [Anaerostipes hadrus]
MNKKNMIRGCLFFIIIAGSIMIWQRYTFHKIQQNKIQQNLKNNLIRFHVRANSDSSFDQACKLKVRDAVISKVSQMMDKADTKEEAFDILKKQKDSIKNTAQEILKKEGVIQKVKVHFVQEKFPEKTYGQYTFPEGIYDALRIDLGEAKGHNWWCVMFPDLCVTKDDKVRINNTARKKMEKLLGKKTVEKITKDKYLGWLFKA